jgi:hypothetical protein
MFEELYVYVTGGRIRGKTLGSVERYNFQTQSWEKLAPMLEHRGSHGAAGVGADLVVVGGGGFRSNLSTVELLKCDAEVPEWTNLAGTHIHRHALGVVGLDSLVFAIGGWMHGSECTGIVEKLDYESNVWISCAPLLNPRKLHGVAVLQSSRMLYVFGGNCNDGKWYTASVESYDIRKDEWVEKTPLPMAGPCSAITVVDDDVPEGESIFVFMHGHYVLKYVAAEDKYTRLSLLPLEEWYCFDVVVVGHIVYAVGGAEKGKWSKVFYSYDSKSDVWTELPHMHK